MKTSAHAPVAVLRSASLFLLVTSSIWAQTAGLPRFEDYPAGEIFAGTPAAPKLVTPLEQSYAEQIRDGVDKGYGVFHDGKEQKGPNFAGNLIVI